MEGGCQVPIAGFARVEENDEIILDVLVASPDGQVVFKEELRGFNPEELGIDAADLLIEKGAKDLIEKVKRELEGSC
jgi:hydroxymethylbilane synthase